LFNFFGFDTLEVCGGCSYLTYVSLICAFLQLTQAFYNI